MAFHIQGKVEGKRAYGKSIFLLFLDCYEQSQQLPGLSSAPKVHQMQR